MSASTASPAIRRCRICESPLAPFLDFGRMPLGDGFLKEDQFADEYFFQLEAALCESCGMVQLCHDVERERMFHGDYAFFSSTSKRMVEHFERFARMLVSGVTGTDPFAVEIGSNDGSMLAEFARAGIRHLGVDPAENTVAVARGRGLSATCEFFEEESARRIRRDHGAADIITAANCMCHIPYMGSVLRGVRELLHPDGLFVFEDPYLGDIVRAGSFDQFYDEHAFYFSATSVEKMVAAHDLELVAVEPQAVHGGSMRYSVARAGRRARSPGVAAAIAREAEQGLSRLATYDAFRLRAERTRRELPALLSKLKAEGKRVVGYAATAKSATVLNYAGIDSDLLPCIFDTTPSKQGRFSPGAHLPVRPYAEFRAPYPDYALLFAWNHAAEIFQKETAFVAQGGRFIVYVPEVAIVDGRF
jgi:methylation protein EvaC